MGIWDITKKDLWLQIRDRRALVTLLVLPLTFITILGLSTGQLLGWKDSNQMLTIVVTNHDRSTPETGEVRLSQKIIDTLSKRDGLKIVEDADTESIQKKIASGDYNASLTFGREFFKKVDALSLSDILEPENGDLAEGIESLDITITTRDPQASATAIVKQLVTADTIRVIAPFVAEKNSFAATMMRRARERKANEPETPAAEPENEQQPDPGANSVYQEIVPGYTVMFAFFLVNIMARSFIHERELGTLKRLQMAPVSRMSVLLGKTIPFYVVSLVQTCLLFICGKLLFGMSWGTQPWLLLPVILSTSVAATGLGLLVAACVRTDSQVSAYANFIVLTTAGISGCFMPREWLPPLMQNISLCVPHSWALMAYQQLLSRPVVDGVIVFRSCGILLGFGVLFLLLGWWRFRPSD